MSVIKMRCTRVSQYDSGGQNLKEVQLVSTDRQGQPLNTPEEVSFANLSATFVTPNGDDIDHDSTVDVNITASAPAATGTSTSPAPPAAKEPKVQ